MKLTRVEQETIITFNEEERTAGVYTHNAALRRKLDALAADRPEECRVERVGREYIVPKGWIKVKPPRVMSEKQRVAALAALHAPRGARSDCE